MKVVSINAPTLLWPCDWDSFLCWKNVLRTCHRLSLPYRSQWKQTSTLLLWWQSPWILRVKWWACLCISTWGPVVGRMGTWKLQGYIQPQEEKKYCRHKTRSATLWPFHPAHIRAGMCLCNAIFKTANFHCSRSLPVEREVWTVLS